MLTFNFSPYPTLETERLTLRQLSREDVNEIFFLRSDEQTLKYIHIPPAQSNDDAMAWIEKILKFQDENESILWAMVEKGGSKLIGTICLWNLSPQDHRGEIGFNLYPQYHGKRLMQEAIEVVLKYGFETMQLHAIEGHVIAGNTASIKRLEKNGFVREGYFKDRVFFNGKYSDLAVYCLLRDE